MTNQRKSDTDVVDALQKLIEAANSASAQLGACIYNTPSGPRCFQSTKDQCDFLKGTWYAGGTCPQSTSEPGELAVPSAWDAAPALRSPSIESILVHVTTTEDDKDRELWWDAYILLEGKWLGRLLDVGKEQEWPNGDQRDLRVPLSWAFPFAERLRLGLLIIQRSTSGNPGWEGKVAAQAVLVGGQLQPVLADTGNFKLGESGNPLSRDFPFNR